jgi:hypothetical protein
MRSEGGKWEVISEKQEVGTKNGEGGAKGETWLLITPKLTMKHGCSRLRTSHFITSHFALHDFTPSDFTLHT